MDCICCAYICQAFVSPPLNRRTYVCIHVLNLSLLKRNWKKERTCLCPHIVIHTHPLKLWFLALPYCKPELMCFLFSHNASVCRPTGNGNGYGGGSSGRCCTIRLVPFPLIALTLSHLACDTSNAGAFLCHLIDQNKHIILWLSVTIVINCTAWLTQIMALALLLLSPASSCLFNKQSSRQTERAR